MNEEYKYCPKCKRDVPLSGWILNKARYDGLSGHCRSCHNAISDETRRKRRTTLMEKLGGKCVRCGFSELGALQIDHVNGDGAVQRRKINTNTVAFQKIVLENPDQYQLLCANCNTLKRLENEEHRNKNTYKHQVPTIDRPRTSKGKHSPETNARRAVTMKANWENADELKKERAEQTRKANASRTDEERAVISAKISASKVGKKKGLDGKMHQPGE